MTDREETRAMLERVEELTKKIIRVLHTEDARRLAATGKHLPLMEGLLALSGATSSTILLTYGVEDEDMRQEGYGAD